MSRERPRRPRPRLKPGELQEGADGLVLLGGAAQQEHRLGLRPAASSASTRSKLVRVRPALRRRPCVIRMRPSSCQKSLMASFPGARPSACGRSRTVFRSPPCGLPSDTPARAGSECCRPRARAEPRPPGARPLLSEPWASRIFPTGNAIGELGLRLRERPKEKERFFGLAREIEDRGEGLPRIDVLGMRCLSSARSAPSASSSRPCFKIDGAQGGVRSRNAGVELDAF